MPPSPPATRIEVVTEGLLIRRLQSDPVARRRRRRDPGRGARAFGGIRPGAGAVPRPAACAAPGAAADRHVGNRRGSPPCRTAGRGGDRQQRSHVPGRDQPRRPRHPRSTRAARGDGPCRPCGAGGARRRHPRVPARHGRDPPCPDGARGLWRAGAAVARRPAASHPGSRAAAGRGAAGGAGDIDRRDLAHRSRRAHRGGWRLAPGAAARSVHRPDAADDAAYFPFGGRAAGRASRARGAGGRGPAVVHGAASRPGPRTTGPRSSRRICRGWLWTAPPGDRRRPICRSSIRHRRAPWPRQPRCWRNLARSMPRGVSPTPDGAWPRSARIRGWRR